MAARLFAGVVAAVALGAVGSAAAGQVPILRSATVAHHHLVLELSVGDLRPVQFAIAKRPATGADGVLLAKDVRSRETIQLPAPASGVVAWTSHEALEAGVYYVQVTAVETGGVTDCPKFLRNCNERWSGVRRVVVRSG